MSVYDVTTRTKTSHHRTILLVDIFEATLYDNYMFFFFKKNEAHDTKRDFWDLRHFRHLIRVGSRQQDKKTKKHNKTKRQKDKKHNKTKRQKDKKMQKDKKRDKD